MGAGSRGGLGTLREEGGLRGTFYIAKSIEKGGVLIVSSICAAKDAVSTVTKYLGEGNTKGICFLAIYVNEEWRGALFVRGSVYCGWSM